MKKQKPILTPEDIDELEKCMIESDQTTITILLWTEWPLYIRVKIETAEDKPKNRAMAVVKVIEKVLAKNPTLKLAEPPIMKICALNRNYSSAYLKFRKKTFWERLFSKKT